MANNFYQMNNEILKLEPYGSKGDLEKIQFNDYLCRKENLQRTKGELERGLFKLSYATIIADTGLKRWKVQELIKWFEDNKIIECIEKSTTKGKESVYAYTSVYYIENELKNHTDNHTNNHTDNHTNLYSISNGLDSIDHTDNHTNNHTDNHTSKKEKEKEYKKTNISASTFGEVDAKYKDTYVYKGYKVKAKFYPRKHLNYYNCDNEYIGADNGLYEIPQSEINRVNEKIKKSYNRAVEML